MFQTIIENLKNECVIHSKQILMSIDYTQENIYTHFIFNITSSHPTVVSIKINKCYISLYLDKLREIATVCYDRNNLLLLEHINIYDIIEILSPIYEDKNIEIEYNSDDYEYLFTIAYIVIELSQMGIVLFRNKIDIDNTRYLYELIKIIQEDYNLSSEINQMMFMFYPIQEKRSCGEVFSNIVNYVLRIFDNNIHLDIQFGAYCTQYMFVELMNTQAKKSTNIKFTESKGMVLTM